MDRKTILFLVTGLVVALAVAGGLSLLASDEPDGLERVAIDEGFADEADEHPLGEGPLADYQASPVEDEGWSTALAGVVGVALAITVTMGLLSLIRRRGGRGS